MNNKIDYEENIDKNELFLSFVYIVILPENLRVSASKEAENPKGCDIPYYGRIAEQKDLVSALEGIPVLEEEINSINKANGWNVCTPEDWEDDYKIPAILALIHSEVSEALEAFRKNDKENFAEELSDVFIRLLDCTGGLEIDLASATLQKIEKNRTRSYKHGGKRV